MDTGTGGVNFTVTVELNRLLTQWQSWGLRSKPKVIKPFAGGLNHEAVLLHCDGQYRVLKRFSTPSPQAISHQQWAAQQRLAPAVIYADPESCYCLMAAIDAPPLTPQTVSCVELRAIGAALRELHQQSPTPAADHFAVRSACETYLSALDERASALHEQLLPLLEQFTVDSTPHCFCHNDLVAENCFVEHQRGLFIDWEYAALNNPWFDLAGVRYYLQLTPAEFEILIQSYQESWLALAQAPIASIAEIAVLWLDILWHLHKNGASYWPRLQRKLQELQNLVRQLGSELYLS